MQEKKIYRLPEKSETPFTVPEGYFDASFQQVVAKTTAIKELPFTAPADYFVTLEQRISEKLLPEKIPFQTPEHYFDQLSKKILERKGQATSNTIPTQLYWGVGALAASLALIVGLFLVLSPTSVEEVADGKSSQELLAAIDKNTAHQYLETSGAQYDEQILELAEQKNIKLPEFGDQKISNKEKEQWKQELELEDLDDLDLEM